MPDSFDAILIVAIVFLGLWQIVCSIAVFSGLTFRHLQLASFGWLAVASCASYVLVRSWFRRDPSLALLRPSPGRVARLPWRAKLATATGLGLFYTGAVREGLSVPYVVLWASSVLLLVANRLDGPELSDGRDGPEPRFPWRSKWIVWAVCAASAILYLLLRTSDPDVALSLNVAVSTIDHPELPLLSFDGMMGDLDQPFISPIYFVQTHELLVAVVASMSGLPTAAVYYLVFPVLFSVLLIIAHHVLLRQFIGREAAFGVVVAFFFLVTWAGGLAYGSYTYDFLFLAKATVAVLWVPAIMAVAFRFSESPGIAEWALLVLAQAAAVHASSTSLIVAPMAAALALIAAWRPGWPATRRTLVGFASSGYIVLLGLWIRSESDTVELTACAAACVEGAGAIAGTLEGMAQVMGGRLDADAPTGVFVGGRMALAYLGLLLAALVPGEAGAWRRRAGLVLAAVVLVFNPWVPGLLTELVAFNLYWRVFWAIPFPLMLAVSVTALLMRFRQSRSVATVLVLAMLAFAVRGPVVPEPGRFTWPGYKVLREYGVALALVEELSPRDVLLASSRISEWVPTIHHAPKILVVREHYLLEWSPPGLSQEEIATRHLLFRMVSGDPDIRSMSAADAVREILERGVTVVVFPSESYWSSDLSLALAEAGYRSSALDDYLVWRRDPWVVQG